MGFLKNERGYSLVELLTVMVILSFVMSGVTAIFIAGLHSQARQTAVFEGQTSLHVGLDRLRTDVHAACAESGQSATSVTLSLPPCDGSRLVTWCTQRNGALYSLYRNVGPACGGEPFADYLTSGSIFAYTPPNVPTGSYALPRLHIDITINAAPKTASARFHVVDDIAFRNGQRQ